MSKKHRIPKPVTSGIADVPVIMQYENQESGAVSLSMILGYYGKWLAGGTVKEDVGQKIPTRWAFVGFTWSLSYRICAI